MVTEAEKVVLTIPAVIVAEAGRFPVGAVFRTLDIQVDPTEVRFQEGFHRTARTIEAVDGVSVVADTEASVSTSTK